MRGKGPDDLPELFRLDLKEEEFVKETKAKRRVRDTPRRRSSIEEKRITERPAGDDLWV
jgi:hypothetical protein